MDDNSMAKRIKDLRASRNMTLEQVANIVGVGKSTVRKWETGAIANMKRDKIAQLALALQTSPEYLMGWSDNPKPSSILPNNIMSLNPMKQIPRVGNIACGTPILAEQNIDDYVDLPAHISADFALTCKGDSMINAGIKDGDVVYIRQQPEVENGQIAAVMVGSDEATLKRFYREGDVVTLMSENTAVKPFVFVGDDIAKLRIIGLAVGYTHAF